MLLTISRPHSLPQPYITEVHRESATRAGTLRHTRGEKRGRPRAQQWHGAQLWARLQQLAGAADAEAAAAAADVSGVGGGGADVGGGGEAARALLWWLRILEEYRRVSHCEAPPLLLQRAAAAAGGSGGCEAVEVIDLTNDIFDQAGGGGAADAEAFLLAHGWMLSRVIEGSGGGGVKVKRERL